MNVDEVTVEGLTVSAYTIPTDQPEADGTIAWSATTMVLVPATGGGVTGPRLHLRPDQARPGFGLASKHADAEQFRAA